MPHPANWLGAGLVALASAAQAAPSTEELQKQIDALRSTVEALQRQLDDARRVETAAAPAPGAIVAAETGADPTTVATKEDLDGLRADLENYKYEQQRNRETKTALTSRGTTIGGTIVARASYQDAPTSAGSSAVTDDRYSSFDIPTATLNFSGSLYRDYAEGRNLDYRLAFQYAKTTPATSNSNFNVTDAYLRYSFFPTLTGLEEPKLTLTLGQQQIPFGLEAQVGEELRPVINSAQFLSGLGVGNRQIGLILRGDYDPYVDYGFNYRAPLLEYAIGVVNGNGPNKSDDNSEKDWLARAAVTLPVDYNSLLRELKIGASWYKGTKNLADKSGVVSHGRSDRYGFDVYYNHDPFGVTYEFAEGRDEYLAADKSIGGTTRSRGQYLTLFYTWGEQWVKSFRGQAKYDDWWPKSYQAFLRWDQYDPDRSKPNDRTTISTGGLNVFFAETTKFQLNVNHYAYDDAARESVNEYLAQFQFGF
ncbi:hypothetical protein GCM10007860_24330 [Chitiniphilus shinanonensis]|uniref:Phosphate-selective porin O and P n=1 Tax=Chitiniphilus shinanonensis TaxID=553088 RepID=A0ABQ6BZF8_9NEIS|nr:hypothetical protein [Chitiniphilus shinanonensis]GLS05283.1 hypothetical protein GCM10007860_24330 [Chitiniphilus shinanonensis]